MSKVTMSKVTILGIIFAVISCVGDVGSIIIGKKMDKDKTEGK